MTLMKTLIIASGLIQEKHILSELVQACQMVICADGGARYMRDAGILPDVIIGDFDSITADDCRFFEKKQVRMIRHPADKDATDTELAADWAVENGADDITFTGASGVRLDHTLANIFLLKKLAARNVPARIMDDHNEIHVVQTRIELTGKPGDTLSVIPASESVKGIRLDGLAYPLHDAEIAMGSSLGISNRFTGHTAAVSIKSGLIVVTKSRD